jgi:carboxymethylenebutenolidase
MKIAIAAIIVIGCSSKSSPPTDDTKPAPAPATTDWTNGLDETEFKALHELKAEAAPPRRGQRVDLSDGSKAYLSLPEGKTGPLPGVIVIHEWWGLNEHIEHWADRLAAEGYAALAVDLYGGKIGTTPDEAMAIMKAVDPAAASKTIAAAHDFLVKDSRVAAPKTASIGWCFGGAWSLDTALSIPDLDAAVIYYGQLETDPAKLKTIRAELLGVFANQDKGIPPADVDKFEAGLKTANVRYAIHRYDAEHAFGNPSNPRYDQTSATDAWAKVREFLGRTLAR